MAAFGFSINSLTLCGLVLAIGLVVDDAIIVVENVEKYLHRGLRPLEATRAAMAEITTPIVTITLVLAAVFVPVAFMPGMTGMLYNQFAMTIVFSFVFSAFNSLSFSPAMSRLFLREKHGETRFFLFRWFNAGLGWIENSYDAVLEWTAHHWWTIVAPSLVLLGLTGWMIASRPKAFIPTEDQGYLICVVQTPDGTSGEKTAAVIQRVEALCRGEEGVEHTVAIEGLNVITSTNQTNCGVVFARLEDWHERTTPGLRAAGLARDAPGEGRPRVRDAMVMVLQPPPIRGLSQTGGFELMIEDRSGKGVDALQKVVDRFQDEARKRPELAGVFSTFSARVPQLKFDVDRTKARRLDVPISDLFATLQANLGGYYVNDFDLYGKVWKVMVQAEGSVRTTPEDIQNLYVLNRKGERVPLSSLGEVRYALGPIDVPHYNLYAAAKMNGEPASGYSSGQALAAMQEVADDGPARGVRHRVDRHDLPGAEDRQSGDVHLRPLGRLRLPVHGGPLRELDPADGDHPHGAPGDVRRGGRAVALRHAAGRLRADRPGDADRAGDQERDPDRRVRRRDAPGAGDEHPGIGQGGVARAAPADPDDVVRLRHGRVADGTRHRGGCVQPELARHRDRIRDRRQHHPRPVRDPDLLRAGRTAHRLLRPGPRRVEPVAPSGRRTPQRTTRRPTSDSGGRPRGCESSRSSVADSSWLSSPDTERIAGLSVILAELSSGRWEARSFAPSAVDSRMG